MTYVVFLRIHYVCGCPQHTDYAINGILRPMMHNHGVSDIDFRRLDGSGHQFLVTAVQSKREGRERLSCSSSKMEDVEGR